MAYFDKYGVEFTDDRKTLVKCPKELKGRYEIPDGVQYIGNCAFEGCRFLELITISNSVISIGHGAFAMCKNLEDIYFLS